jgi:hypothetical protein
MFDPSSSVRRTPHTAVVRFASDVGVLGTQRFQPTCSPCSNQKLDPG